jgi:hypothetical protein
MAVNFKEIDEKLRNSPLSEKELKTIESVEKHIDKEIVSNYNGYAYRIDLGLASFKQKIFNKTYELPNSEKRRLLMYEELKKRYEEAGWEVSEEIADIHDRFGLDYFVLNGKIL